MAKESFFEINTNLKSVKELLKDYIISFSEEYDEITLKFMGFFIWIYGYYEDNNDNLYVNIKYESKVDNNVITLFEKLLLNIGFMNRDIR
ncbi:hypothetical protein [Treponema pedis]|uniref:hypothetical protein n=1 Tax=Treponema pedis TaxID=409322 RepID=UPI003D22434F